jgi:Na+/H+ antiporter NhaA
MVTFVSTLIFGAVLGFMLEKQVGVPLVKWSRVKRMRMRILRRKGENPWSALLRDDED